jgi:hypothetical protein
MKMVTNIAARGIAMRIARTSAENDGGVKKTAAAKTKTGRSDVDIRIPKMMKRDARDGMIRRRNVVLGTFISRLVIGLYCTADNTFET